MQYGKRFLITDNQLSHLQHLLLHLLWHHFLPLLLLNNVIIQTTVLPVIQSNMLLQHHLPLQIRHITMIMVSNVHFLSQEETTAH